MLQENGSQGTMFKSKLVWRLVKLKGILRQSGQERTSTRRQLAGIMFVWESYLSELPCINNGTILSSILLFYSNGWVDAMYFCTVSSLSITSVTGHTKADSGKPTWWFITCKPSQWPPGRKHDLGWSSSLHWRESLKAITKGGNSTSKWLYNLIYPIQTLLITIINYASQFLHVSSPETVMFICIIVSLPPSRI